MMLCMMCVCVFPQTEVFGRSANFICSMTLLRIKVKVTFLNMYGLTIFLKPEVAGVTPERVSTICDILYT